MKRGMSSVGVDATGMPGGRDGGWKQQQELQQDVVQSGETNSGSQRTPETQEREVLRRSMGEELNGMGLPVGEEQKVSWYERLRGKQLTPNPPVVNHCVCFATAAVCCWLGNRWRG